MPELKTKVNKASVEKFLSAIKDEQKREDCFLISKMMEKVTKSKPEMWGASIVGFGRMKYAYANGKEGGGCLYINKISDIDTKELEKIIKLAVSRKR